MWFVCWTFGHVKVCLLCLCICVFVHRGVGVSGSGGVMKGRSHRAGRAARKRRQKCESTVQSGIHKFTGVFLLSKNISPLFLVSLLLSSITSLSLCFFSLSVSPAAVCEADEVSTPTRIHLNSPAASPLYWYDSGVLLCPTCPQECYITSKGLFTC